MPLAKTGICLFDGLDLFWSPLALFVQCLLFELDKPLILGAHVVLDEDLLNRGTGERDPHTLELVAQSDASPHRICQREFQYLFRYFWRGGLWMGFVYRRKVFQAFQAMCLESTFVFVKLGSRHTASAAGLRNVSQGFLQLQNAQTLLGKFHSR